MCTLVLIAWGQMWTLNGNLLYKACYYDCGSKKHGFYDRVYRVAPEAYCPARFDLV